MKIKRKKGRKKKNKGWEFFTKEEKIKEEIIKDEKKKMKTEDGILFTERRDRSKAKAFFPISTQN